jgi:hypothetical protein
MNWINIETKTLRSPEYIGADPVQRATWLNLLGYCSEQENGGVIGGAKDWKDRRWMQTCGVTLSEVAAASELWAWEGDSLVLWNYPVTKEHEVRAKRDAGKRGGKASGEARREAQLEAVGEAELEAQLEGELERKGKERKGKRKEEEGNGIEDADASASASARPKRANKAQPIDDEHLTQLQTQYPHARVREQFSACTKWWLERKKSHPSRAALKNWLDKVQPPPIASVATLDNGLGNKCRPL